MQQKGMHDFTVSFGGVPTAVKKLKGAVKQMDAGLSKLTKSHESLRKHQEEQDAQLREFRNQHKQGMEQFRSEMRAEMEKTANSATPWPAPPTLPSATVAGAASGANLPQRGQRRREKPYILGATGWESGTIKGTRASELQGFKDQMGSAFGNTCAEDVYSRRVFSFEAFIKLGSEVSENGAWNIIRNFNAKEFFSAEQPTRRINLTWDDGPEERQAFGKLKNAERAAAIIASAAPGLVIRACNTSREVRAKSELNAIWHVSTSLLNF